MNFFKETSGDKLINKIWDYISFKYLSKFSSSSNRLEFYITNDIRFDIIKIRKYNYAIEVKGQTFLVENYFINRILHRKTKTLFKYIIEENQKIKLKIALEYLEL